MTRKPLLTHTRDEFITARAALSGRTALVMTMGALHEGHLQLVREAHKVADHVIVTIFVNPTQFAPGEDYEAYPRTLAADMQALAGVGADLVWAPRVEDMYITAPHITIDPGPVAHSLEGSTRPTHFAGVALVVTKALNIIRPSVALFGEKDAQQLAVIRSVVADLDIPVEIIGVPIVRDTDAVALSSRNQYLTQEQRVHAQALSRSLRVGQQKARSGAGVHEIVQAAHQVLLAEESVDVDYVALVEETTFRVLCRVQGNESADENMTVVKDLHEGVCFDQLEGHRTHSADGLYRLLVAARVGSTRLIDNCLLG
ncbi:pantoate--beta-alanine ligase [Schaalia sp. lx-100]|uniref:pantoate--beta-alanine ligase n=1 Tax=Schaalia sp. lx-100 TaxID=2899081 RepID=UPI001E35184D|nr:pantoate--beta-alanine ligase [Schaalia sp. lx-100]MCD4557734.1 pantoate--beta-alanine ligase [Schaalia sp. lx-100]